MIIAEPSADWTALPVKYLILFTCFYREPADILCNLVQNPALTRLDSLIGDSWGWLETSLAACLSAIFCSFPQEGSGDLGDFGYRLDDWTSLQPTSSSLAYSAFGFAL